MGGETTDARKRHEEKHGIAHWEPDWDHTIHAAYINGRLNHIAIVEGTVADVARRTMAKLKEQGHPVTDAGGNYTGPGNRPVELVFESSVTLRGREDDGPIPWQHHFRRPDQPWSMTEQESSDD